MALDVAREQALLFGKAKRASRERLSLPLPLAASPLARAFSRDSFFTRPNRRACSQVSSQARSTYPLLGQSLAYPAVPTKTVRPLLFWTPDWPGAGLCLAPGENLVATFWRNQTDICGKVALAAFSVHFILMPLAFEFSITSRICL